MQLTFYINILSIWIKYNKLKINSIDLLKYNKKQIKKCKYRFAL